MPATIEEFPDVEIASGIQEFDDSGIQEFEDVQDLTPPQSIGAIGVQNKTTLDQQRKAAELAKRATEVNTRFDALTQMAGNQPGKRTTLNEARAQLLREINEEAIAYSAPFSVAGAGEEKPFFEQVSREEMETLYPKTPPVVRDVAGAASNVTAGFLEMFKDPFVLSGIGLGKTAPRLAKIIATGFGAHMLASLPLQAAELYEEYKKGNRQGVLEGLGNMGLSGYLGPKLLKHGGVISKTPLETVGEGLKFSRMLGKPELTEVEAAAIKSVKPQVENRNRLEEQAATAPMGINPNAIKQTGTFADFLKSRGVDVDSFLTDPYSQITHVIEQYDGSFEIRVEKLTPEGMVSAKLVNVKNGESLSNPGIPKFIDGVGMRVVRPDGTMSNPMEKLPLSQPSSVPGKIPPEIKPAVLGEVKPPELMTPEERTGFERQKLENAAAFKSATEKQASQELVDDLRREGWTVSGVSNKGKLFAFFEIFYRGKKVSEAETVSEGWRKVMDGEISPPGEAALPWTSARTVAAVGRGDPIPSTEFEGFQNTLSEHSWSKKNFPGYVREGDRYVFKPSSVPTKIPPEIKLTSGETPEFPQLLLAPISDTMTVGSKNKLGVYKTKISADGKAFEKVGEPIVTGWASVTVDGRGNTSPSLLPKKITDALGDSWAWTHESPDSFQPSKPPTEIPPVREAVQTPAVSPPPGTGDLKMRSLSERGTVAESVPPSVQEQIAKSPQSYYEPQSLRGVQAEVKAMDEAQLRSVPKESDIHTAANLELSNKLFEAGRNDEGYQVYQDLSQHLTRLGQVINQAKLLNAMRPEHVVMIVNKSLTQSKRDPLTPVQAGRLQALSTARIESQRALDNATSEWLKNPSDANAVKAERALVNANKADLAEHGMVNQFKKRSIWQVLKAILQGNLLTPISEVANIAGNVNFLPFRSQMRTGAALLDILDSHIRNRPREVSVAPIAGTKAAVGGFIKGVKQIPAILKHGTGDVIKGEARAGLHPLRAWVKQFSKNPDTPTIGGKVPFSERVNLAIEGTFGVPAEIMLRGLGAGDIAPREAARARLISEQMRLKKIPASRNRMAQNFPELFFDKKTLALIESETRGAIFQSHSKTLDYLNSLLKSKGDVWDLAVASVAPYKLTPWNIIGELLSYNPLFATGRAVLEAKRGNIRAAEKNASKSVVGGMLIYAGWWLYQKGLLAPSMDSRGEQPKARLLAGEVLPPNHINVSGLRRALTGGDPTFKPGDDTRNIFRAGGLAGSMFYMAANVGRDIETKPETDAAIISLFKNSTIEQARFGLNQSFLKGVTSLLDAVREGDVDNQIQTITGTMLSIPLPNTLSALSRAEREYKVDMKADTLAKQVGNVVKTRLGFAGLDDYMALKRGLWGEPLRETPKEANALVYNFFDVTKGKQVTDDATTLELYRLWRKTASTSVIPEPPEKVFTFANTQYPLTPAQRSRLAELIGTRRREIVDKIVINPEWHKQSDAEKIELLGEIYRAGAQQGKDKFWLEDGANLTPKKPKAGFKQATQ